MQRKLESDEICDLEKHDWQTREMHLRGICWKPKMEGVLPVKRISKIWLGSWDNLRKMIERNANFYVASPHRLYTKDLWHSIFEDKVVRLSFLRLCMGYISHSFGHSLPPKFSYVYTLEPYRAWPHFNRFLLNVFQLKKRNLLLSYV